MQKARRHNFMRCSDRLQADGFRICFTPLFKVLFTFPSRYWFAIGLSGVFSLAGWAPPVQPGFLVSRPTQDTHRLGLRFAYGTVTPYGRPFQVVPLRLPSLYGTSYNPGAA